MGQEEKGVEEDKMQEVEELEEVVEEETTKEKTKGELALEEYRLNATPEQKQQAIDKARETREKNQKEKREIEVATRTIMMQKFKYIDAQGQTQYGNGYDLRANALFQEVVNHGKNMIGAEKQLNLYLNENVQDDNSATTNEIKIIMVQGQEINI